MKKALIVLSFFAFSTSIFGQMNTGSFFAAANSSFNLGFSTMNNIDADSKKTVLTYNLNPKAGYFIKNRLGIGGSIEFSSDPWSNDLEFGRDSKLILGPFARYYIQYGTLIPFGEIGMGFGYNNSITYYLETDPTKDKYSFMLYSLAAGTDIFLNEKIALEVMLKYKYEKKKPSADGSTGSGHSESGLSALFGIVIFFESI